MSHLHTVIVPGVGGSDADHWQSWLQNHLSDTSRVEQQNWHLPVLNVWVDQFYQHIRELNRPVQVVAHSFGCLTAIAALSQYPVLQRWVKSVLLVAPANPQRFSAQGFAASSNDLSAQPRLVNAEQDLGHLFKQFSLNVAGLMVLSENDPWINFEDAVHYADLWNVPYINEGLAGHINVASGHGKWSKVLRYLDSIDHHQCQMSAHFFETHHHFRFAL